MCSDKIGSPSNKTHLYVSICKTTSSYSSIIEVINSFTGYVNNLYPGNQINFSAWASENLSDEYYYALVID